MRRSVWVHQWNQLAEQTSADIAATLLPRGITSVYIKAIDGPYYMGDVYSHPLVPRDSASMAVLVNQFAAEGLTLVPWVVPRRQASEANVHVDCATAAGGRLIIDWEYHYAGFWEGTLAAAVEYHDTLQAAVQAGLWIASAPDPRQVGRDYQASLIAHLSAYLPQDYWVDFQVSPIGVLADSFQKLEQYGPVEPILPHTATAADMQAGLVYCFGQGVQAVSLWLMGHANAAQLDAFAQRVPGEEHAPEPSAAEFRNALGYLAGDVMQPLRSYKYPRIKAAVAEVDRVAAQYGAG